MPLASEHFEKIKNTYDAIRLKHTLALEERKKEIQNKIPGFKELNDKVISLSMEHGRKLLTIKGDETKKEELNRTYHAAMLDIKLEKKKLLTDAGYPYDYLELKYDCSKCRDTGYVDGEKCSCYHRMEAGFLYDSSHIKELLTENNFSNLSRDYYTGDDLEIFDEAVNTCKNYIDNFNSDYRNILFYGTVGTGKSFLSGCIAKELIDKGCSVVYFSAISLFQSISNHIYDKEKDTFNELYDTVLECDLLIIDDLGTEITNEFVRSQLFNILNERNIRRKSIVISTNLTLEGIRDKYSDRVFSRIYESYELIKLSVYKDIRLQKKLELRGVN